MNLSLLFRTNVQSALISRAVRLRGAHLKGALAATAVILAAATAAAQEGATVNFGNHQSSKVINGLTGLPLTTSDNVRAALYWAPLESGSFVQLGATVTVGFPMPGLFVGGTRAAGPETPRGSSARFQVRAWSGGYATYEQAAAQPGVLIGRSAVFVNQTGDPAGGPPGPPVSLLAGGLSGFTLSPNESSPNRPAIAVTKQCPPQPVPPGGTLVFTGTITNTGNATLTGVLVVNDHPVPNTAVFGPATLAPGAGAQFSASYRVPACSCGPFVDTLTASGTSVYGGVATNSVTTACPGTSTYGLAGDLNGDGIVDQDELNAVLANYWAGSQWVCMTNPVSLGGGFFQVALTNVTGWNFTVLASTNHADWAPLAGPAYPVYQFYDEQAASNAPMRLYRLRWP